MPEPRDLLDLSKAIYAQHEGEFAYRTVISRAYYSTFYCSKAIHDDRELGHIGATHEAISKALQADKKLQSIGNQMDSLRRSRKHADYQLHKPVNPSHAKRVLSMAHALHCSVEKAQGEG